LRLVHTGEQIIHPLLGFGGDVDGGCLAGTWHYLDGEYLLPFTGAEKPLTCLVLNPRSTLVGVFVGSAFLPWALIPICFAMFLDAAMLSTCVIAFFTFDLKHAS